MIKLECYTEPMACELSVFISDLGYKSIQKGKAVLSDYAEKDIHHFLCACIRKGRLTDHDKDCLSA